MQDIYIGTSERHGCPTIFAHNLISINVCLYHTAYRERGLLLKGLLWRGVSSWTCLEKESGFQQWRYTARTTSYSGGPLNVCFCATLTFSDTFHFFLSFFFSL